MNRSDLDWAYCRRGMLTPGVALLVSLTLVSVALWYQNKVDMEFGAASNRLQSAEQLRNERDAKDEAVTRFSADYRMLVDAGVIGDERRLERIELLRTAAADLKLPYVRYTISGQEVFKASYLPAGLTSQVLSSTLNLQIGLAHELDLLNLITELRRGPGLFHVRSCRLERATENSTLSVSRPNINGECTVDWLTIPDRPAADQMFADNGGFF